MIKPTAYWGSIGWWKQPTDEVEVMESFPKQTLRNRCIILSATGEPITLSVPVKKVEHKQLTRDVEVSYDQRWQHQHWMAILSAYKKSPYFDYYQDYIRPIYEKEWRFLLDLNEQTYDVASALLRNEMPGRHYPLRYTADWQGQELEAVWGEERSILDELFLRGPEAKVEYKQK